MVAEAADTDELAAGVLLLSAMGLPHVVAEREEGAFLLVPTAHAARARAELDGAREEQRQVPDPPPVLRGGARAGFPAAFALLASHLLLNALPARTRAVVFAAGELDSARVRAGEGFRVATALCLHADGAHVVGNAIATLIFVAAAGDWVGPGLAILCTIVAGIVGNLGAALVDPSHHAIGFSTATFGALGLSAVFGFVARYRNRVERQRAWLALGGGLALLAMLGAGERSDLLAHLLGLAAGVGLGVLVSTSGRVGSRKLVAPGAVWQGLAALLGLGLLAGAWLWAQPVIAALRAYPR